MIYTLALYRNKTDHKILLIPSGINKDGIRTDINKPVFIDDLSNTADVGEKVNEGIKICKSFETTEEKVYRIATGIKNWEKFSKERTSVSIIIDTDKNITILPMRLETDGYYSEIPDKGINLELTPTNEELGKAVEKSFGMCEE